MIDKKELKEFTIFKGLSDAELASIVEICHERTLEKGKLLFNQGEKARELCLCRSGAVDIIVQLYEPHGIKVTVHNLKGGEIFGWSSLIKPKIYTASAICSQKTEEIYIKATDLLRLFEEKHHIGYIMMLNLSSVISSRLMEYRKKLAVEIASDIRKDW
jgi:CRP/FNR family transcriptional regulator, cyclic AMP receptor protein